VGTNPVWETGSEEKEATSISLDRIVEVQIVGGGQRHEES